MLNQSARLAEEQYLQRALADFLTDLVSFANIVQQLAEREWRAGHKHDLALQQTPETVHQP